MHPACASGRGLGHYVKFLIPGGAVKDEYRTGDGEGLAVTGEEKCKPPNW
jgi:hypothetical protein